MQTTLSPREMEMVELTAFGLAQKEIAERLRVSIHTVDVTIRHAKEKLHVQKSTEIAAWYFISKYNIRLSLSETVKRMVSLSFLSLIAFTLFTGYQPERSFRSHRARRHNELELFTI